MKLLQIVGVACLLLLFYGCAGTPSGANRLPADGASAATVRDSLRAKFILTMIDSTGKPQELDAVMFSVPGARYRMELTGPMGIGVASLLWTKDGWNMVFPTEKMYLHGNGYMVGMMNDKTFPLVPIHQVADFFDGILVPEGSQTLSELDSAGFHVVKAKAPNGLNFSYGKKDGQISWLSSKGRNGGTEVLKFESFRTFEGVLTPETIIFEQDGKMFLKIKIRKVARKKPFSPGTWRLNIPKSYKSIEG